MQRHRLSVRVWAAAGGLSLVAALATVAPGASVQASARELLRQAAADIDSPASAVLDPGIVAHLPQTTAFRLSPELAAAYGAQTIDLAGAQRLLERRASRPAAAETPAVGTARLWPALDTAGTSGLPLLGIYLKEYTLLAKGQHIEVWVASGKDQVSEGTEFPAGDCRAVDYDPTVVTKQLAEGLIREFDEKMFPASSKNFSAAPARDGTGSLGQLEAPWASTSAAAAARR